jgi:hypothetical protein
LIAVIVLTNVVTTSALDWFLGVPKTVVVEVPLTEMLGLKVVDVVSLAPLLPLVDTVTPEIVLLWLYVLSMLVVVALVRLEDAPVLVVSDEEAEPCA